MSRLVVHNYIDAETKHDPHSGQFSGSGGLAAKATHHMSRADYHEKRAGTFRLEGQHGIAQHHQSASEAHLLASSHYRRASLAANENTSYEHEDKADKHAAHAIKLEERYRLNT